MAKATVIDGNEFLKGLENLGTHTDEIIEKTLESGAKAAAPYFKSYLALSVGNSLVLKRASRSTGELLNSVGITKVRVDRNGVSNIKVGFNEPRRRQPARKGKRSYYQLTNAMIANVIEYGKREYNQPARPFLRKALKASESEVERVMENTFNQEVEKLI